MGDRTSNITEALYHISKTPCSIIRVSSLYETEPVGHVEQADFINAVIEIRSDLTADKLLHSLLRIESVMGRVRRQVWEPRIIDLDILSIQATVIFSTYLKVPHPQLAHRRFVLVPFQEIAADYWVAGFDKNVRQLLKETTDKSRVKLYKVIEVK